MKVISRRTWVISAVFGAVALALAGLILLWLEGALFVSDTGEPLLLAGVAATIVTLAFRFPAGEPARVHWALIGFGILCFALGDLIWAYYELILGIPAPFPGAADVLYLEYYPLIAAGLLGATYSIKWLSGARNALLISYGVAAALAVILYATLLHEVILDPAEGWVSKVLTVAYPLGDLFFIMAPALALILALRPFGARVLAWPWWLAGAGALILAAADTAYVYLDWRGTYVSGHPIDVLWLFGNALMVIAASVALDVYRLSHPA
jgi:hypothetical protein